MASASSSYRRALIKISGEALMGSQGYGLDVQVLTNLVSDLKTVIDLGVQACLVVGGGNMFRGLAGVAEGMDRVSGDYMGMLATVMNALALQNFFLKVGLETHVLSAISMPPICEFYSYKQALGYIEAGKIVIFAAGTGDPFFTTDTAAALRAAEMKCDVILKGTNVDGVYSSDPKKEKSAVRYESLTYRAVLSQNLKVMDSTAIALAEENKIPVLVFDMNKKDAFKNAILGKGLSTKISAI